MPAIFHGVGQMQHRTSLFLGSAILLLTSSLMAVNEDMSFNQRFTAYADYVALNRDHLNNKKVVSSPGKNLGTKKTLDRFKFESGYRVGLFYHTGSFNSFEASFMHVNEWEGSSHIKGMANLSFPFSNPSFAQDFFQANYAREEYKSQFNTAEVNWWYHFTPRRVNYFSFSSILGIRYIPLDEEFHLTFKKNTYRSSYDVETKNRLYGGHIGGNLQWNPTDALSWEITGKAGAFYNPVENHLFVGDLNNTVTLVRFQREGSTTTFLGEAALLLSYQLGRYVNVHLGYQILYLANLALAPEQVTSRTEPTLRSRLNKEGTIMIQGAFAGINFGF